VLFKRLNRLTGCLVAIPLVFSSAAALASDTSGHFALHGVGAQTCAQLLDEVKKNDTTTNNLILSWIMGYMTARNRFAANTYDVTPAMPGEVVLQMTDTICEKSPDARVETAMDALFKGLAPARVTVDSPFLDLQSGDVSFRVRRETFMAVQDALRKKKLYTGRNEEKMTPAISAALKAYQRDQKLQEDGLPDAPTVIRLLVASPGGKAR
jgi:hypothetical protein